MSGSSLSTLEHSCAVVMASQEDPRPAQFNDREWLTSMFTTDGKRVVALLHEEYQGNRHAGRCPSRDYFKCWYNAITFAVSTDGGRSFQNGRTPPNHLVASVPYRYRRDAGPFGLFQPSNIVRKPDGYFYVLVRAAAYGAQEAGVCLLRTPTLESPNSWRAWDGSAFQVKFSNPYVAVSSASPTCEPIAHSQVNDMTQSLTFNNYLGEFVLLGEAGKFDLRRGEMVWGFYSATSEDLLHWSDRQLVMETELAHTHQCGDPSTKVHPSIIDPNSASQNFVTVGHRAYLYFTRIKYDASCRLTKDRDLFRIPIEFSK
jgi:hypothetical protein